MLDKKRLSIIRESIKDTPDFSLNQLEMKKGPRFHSDEMLINHLVGHEISPEKATDLEIKEALMFLAEKDWHAGNKDKWK